MLRQYIEIGKYNWNIYVYYNVGEEDYYELANVLFELDCPKRCVVKSLRIVTNQQNTGMTFTNTDMRTSVVFISKATSGEQFANTVVHEAKHVQSHICEDCGIDETGEPAAYLIGYIVQRMYRILKAYGGF